MLATGAKEEEMKSATNTKAVVASNRVNLFGVDIDNISMNESLERVASIVEAGEYRFGVTPNVDHMMRLRDDAAFREIYRAAHLVVADGVPLVWASSILGTPLKGRVNGTDLFERSCSMAAQRGYSVYFLGGNEGTAGRAADRLLKRHPSLRITGFCSPEIDVESEDGRNEKIQAQVRQSGADILFVAIGSPKQEKWIYRYGQGSGVSFAIGVGVSLSFVAGDIQRAPEWMQRHGLEWLSRLCSEPRRLWKRYLINDIPFVGLVFRAWAKQLRGRFFGAAVNES